MTNSSDFGLCATCFKPMTDTQYAVSLHQQSLLYDMHDEASENPPIMTLQEVTNVAVCCCLDCCNTVLPTLLKAQGLSPNLVDNQVTGGMVHPCGHCGSIVLLTAPHAAFVKQKQVVELEDGELVFTISWFDILAVLCVNCGEAEAATIRERERMVG